jgi:hypothetical protein
LGTSAGGAPGAGGPTTTGALAAGVGWDVPAWGAAACAAGATIAWAWPAGEAGACACAVALANTAAITEIHALDVLCM